MFLTQIRLVECILIKNMILLKKMGTLRPLLPAAMFMRFSSQPERRQLSLSAQKAVWATSIINAIMSATPPSTIWDPSLRDVILNLPNPSEEFDFHKNAREEVMILFNDGIYLAQPFLAQPRIQQAQQFSSPPPPLSKRSSIKTTGQSKPKQAKKFIFFPNYNVTTPMFQQLMRYSVSKNILLTGGFGISKTVSVVLFIHLCYHQSCFVFEALREENKKNQLDSLIEKRLMPKQVAKYWYWTVENEQTDIIISKLLAQTVQLDDFQRQLLKKLKKEKGSLVSFRGQIQELYSTQYIQNRTFVDQINVIASQMRTFNQFIRFLPTDKYNSNLARQKIDSMEWFKLRLQIILKIGSHFTLSSPVAIQADLLEKGYQGLHFISTHKSLDILRFPYELKLETKSGQIDLWQIFWFEIQRRMKFQGLQHAEIEAAKLRFFKIVQDMQVQTFYRFYYIRTFLSTHYDQFIKSFSSKENTQLKQLIDKFQAHSLQESKKKLLTFMGKEKGELNHIILNCIYLTACTFRTPLNRHQPLKINVCKLQNVVNSRCENKRLSNISLLQILRKNNDLKEILASWSDEQITLQWTYDQFIQLGSSIFSSSSGKQSDNWTRYRAQVHGQSASARGIQIEYTLRRCLINNGKLGFKAMSKQNVVQENFKIDESVAFSPINSVFTESQTQNNVSMKQNFKDALQTAKKNPEKDILELPYNMENGKRIRFAQQSAVIDFLIVQYNKVFDTFFIWSFDATISAFLYRKVSKVKKLYNDLLIPDKQIDGSALILKHVILCSKYSKVPNSEKQSKEDDTADQPSYGITIEYANLEELEIRTNDEFAQEQIWAILDFHQALNKKKAQQKKEMAKQKKLQAKQKKLQAKQKQLQEKEKQLKEKIKQMKEQMKEQKKKLAIREKQIKAKAKELSAKEKKLKPKN